MKKLLIFLILTMAVLYVPAQNTADLQKLYDTEKTFERAAAEKGVNQAFVEYTAPFGVCFFNGQVNCREYWKARPASPAALFWNPNFVDVSSNGSLGYTTGNSIYRPKGKTDETAYYGQYATVWQRQSDGNYLAVLDIGISHEKPASVSTDWKSPADSGKEMNAQKSSAADSSVGFYETAEKQGALKAYKTYLAEDSRVLRDGKEPFIGKQDALAEIGKLKSKIRFAKRSMFVGAADMAYVNNTYTIIDKAGNTTETGNFLQVWKLRGGKWQIVLDVFLPNPPEKK